MKVLDITPRNNPHELCSVICSLHGTSRKIICIGAYLTTALDQASAEIFLEYFNDLLHSHKAKYRDPHIIVAGDWNKANTGIALDDFLSVREVPTPPTRGDEFLDLIFTNMSQSRGDRGLPAFTAGYGSSRPT